MSYCCCISLDSVCQIVIPTKVRSTEYLFKVVAVNDGVVRCMCFIDKNTLLISCAKMWGLYRCSASWKLQIVSPPLCFSRLPYTLPQSDILSSLNVHAEHLLNHSPLLHPLLLLDIYVPRPRSLPALARLPSARRPWIAHRKNRRSIALVPFQ